MNIDIEPVEMGGKRRYRLKIDGKGDRILNNCAVGKTALRIRVNEILTQI